MPQVRSERTGWRDEELSRRHRKWGWDCPAVDLDFLMLEYDRGRATAIVEYKHENAAAQYASHPTYQAMINLGNRAGVPVIGCRYTDDFSTWNVVPLNAEAKKRLPERTVMSETEWIKFLYELRGYECPQEVLEGIGIEI